MEPAYHNGQLLILDKHSENYDYGDVIAFKKRDIGGYLVKRIIAVPGDSVSIKDGIIYVNERPQNTEMPEIDYAGIAQERIYLGKDDYFVMGDNVNESKDSRYGEIGMVNRDEIKGKVIR